MKAINSGDEFYDLWVLLARTRDVLQCVRQQELSRDSISWEQFATLYAIVSSGKGITIADISRSIFRQPHTASDMATRLEKEGLVQKSRSCLLTTSSGFF